MTILKPSKVGGGEWMTDKKILYPEHDFHLIIAHCFGITRYSESKKHVTLLLCHFGMARLTLMLKNKFQWLINCKYYYES